MANEVEEQQPTRPARAWSGPVVVGLAIALGGWFVPDLLRNSTGPERAGYLETVDGLCAEANRATPPGSGVGPAELPALLRRSSTSLEELWWAWGDLDWPRGDEELVRPQLDLLERMGRSLAEMAVHAEMGNAPSYEAEYERFQEARTSLREEAREYGFGACQALGATI